MSALRDWADKVRKATANDPFVVDPQEHQPTANERNNLCFLSMKYLLGWPMRSCDFMIVESMGSDKPTAEYFEILAEYMWDHLAGEPDDVSVGDLVYAIEVIWENLCRQGADIRNDIVAV